MMPRAPLPRPHPALPQPNRRAPRPSLPACPLPHTLFSKLYLLRSRDSVARRSPWVKAPCQEGRKWSVNRGSHLSLHPARGSPCQLTRLSSLLATMEANLRSPASSEIRKTYSGAET